MDEPEPSTSGREDRLAYGVLYGMGIGLLIPWNAFITAADFFAAKYPGQHADRLFTVAYLPVQLMVLAAMIHYDTHLPTRPRIIAGFISFAGIMLFVPLLEAVSAGALRLGTTLACVAITAVADGLAQGALYAEAALLPPEHTQALVAGTAASGAVISLLRILTKAALPGTPAGLRLSAEVYFTCAAAVCLACLAAYVAILPRLTPALAQKRQASLLKPKRSGMEAQVPMAQPIAGYHAATDQGELQSEASALFQGQSSTAVGAQQQPQQQHAAAAGTGQALYWVAGKSVWRLAAALVVTYTVTLAIFPGVLAEDVASQELGDWFPVILFTLFNFADLAGKSIPMWGQHTSSHRTILQLALARILFVPAFAVAARLGVGPWWVCTLSVLLGVSNGYATALAMVAAPVGLQGPVAAMAGQIVVFCLVLGLCFGAACGFLWLL